MTYDAKRALDLIARIDESRRDFQREIQSRRRLLQSIHDEPEAQLPLDPLMGAIEQQWQRLYAHYGEVSRRYRRRFKKPPPRTIKPLVADPDDWRAFHWQLDSNSRPISNVANAVAAMREAPELSGLIALDETTSKIMLKGPLPFAHWETFTFEMRQLKDADLTGLLEYLQIGGLATLTRDDCLAAVRMIARENAWTPGHE